MASALGWLLLLGVVALDVWLDSRRQKPVEIRLTPDDLCCPGPPLWCALTMRDQVSGAIMVCATTGLDSRWGEWDAATCEIVWQCDVSDVPEGVIADALAKVYERLARNPKAAA